MTRKEMRLRQRAWYRTRHSYTEIGQTNDEFDAEAIVSVVMIKSSALIVSERYGAALYNTFFATVIYFALVVSY